MKFEIPPAVNEAGNGALVVLLVTAAMFFAIYLFRSWRDLPETMKFQTLYTYENKAVIALLTLTIGLSIKVGAEWWWFHLRNNGMNPNYPVLLPAFLVGTLMSIWGLICLMRAISRYDWPKWRWAWIAIAAIAFGVIVAAL